MHPLLNIAIQAARSASRVILKYIDRLDSVTISEKGKNDLVSEVDRFSEQEIIYTIRKAYPGHSILAEESGHHHQSDRYCWIIDPLDGTTNYLHGFPQFAISIAARVDDKLEVGVVYDPLRDELFSAAAGQGAQMNHRRMRVSKTPKLEDALIGTGFPFREMQNFEKYLKIFSTVLPIAQGIRRAGSAALDLAYVGCGRLDGFWESGLSEWDMAAGALLIKEAGGTITDYRGEHHYLKTGEVVAGNPKVFTSLLEIVQRYK